VFQGFENKTFEKRSSSEALLCETYGGQVSTFHDGCKQGIDQQIFNRKSISREITSEWLHFKNCWKSGPKVPTQRDQWPMAKGSLDHVGLSGNFMTIITEDNQIFVYIQW